MQSEQEKQAKQSNHSPTEAIPTMPIDDSQFSWQKGFKLSLVIAMGYVPAGITFGVLAQTAGLPIWSIIALSVIVYAGAAQFACIPMLVAGIPKLSITANITAINLRHLFYGLPLLNDLPQSPLAKTYCLFALTDETFSVLTSMPKSQRTAMMLPVSLFNHGWWILGSLLGALLGDDLSELIPNLDFALVCLFAVLAYEQYQKIKRTSPIMMALLSFIIASLFTQDWRLLLAIGLSTTLILAGFMMRKHTAKHT